MDLYKDANLDIYSETLSANLYLNPMIVYISESISSAYIYVKVYKEQGCNPGSYLLSGYIPLNSDSFYALTF